MEADAMEPSLLEAGDSDLAAVAALVNAAYRGEGARQGWTSEADLLDGVRTDEATLRRDLAAKPRARLLALRDGMGALLGCVWLEPEADDTWFLAMLTVRPDIQARGTGRRLLAGAETFVRAQGAVRLRMTVIDVRDTLIAWYQRRGYVPTGESLPVPYGNPPRTDLSFAVLTKPLPLTDDGEFGGDVTSHST